MAATPSSMLALGTEAPDFKLPDTGGSLKALDEVRGKKGTLVFFLCNHCPYVIHIREELARVTQWAFTQGIGVAGINSNDIENYPEDSPEKMKIEKKNAGYAFPYLFDETQAVAKAYHAACTPDFFLFDRDLKLVYRGQFDESRPRNQIAVTGKDLKEAITCLIEGKSISPDQRPSLGCNIKWKAT